MCSILSCRLFTFFQGLIFLSVWCNYITVHAYEDLSVFLRKWKSMYSTMCQDIACFNWICTVLLAKQWLDWITELTSNHFRCRGLSLDWRYSHKCLEGFNEGCLRYSVVNTVVCLMFVFGVFFKILNHCLNKIIKKKY